MNFDKYKEMVDKMVVASMLSYMEEDEECGYTSDNVKACKVLLDGYLDVLKTMKAPSDDEIMQQVKNVVLSLNELNEKADYALIETDQREVIWEIIQTSAVDCGLQEYEDDITEEWREW